MADEILDNGQCQCCGLFGRHRRDCPYKQKRARAAGAAQLEENARAARARKSREEIDAEIAASTKDYLLRDIPADVHARATKRAEADGLPLRSVLIALLDAYAARGVTMRLRPGRSIPEARPGK